jgi:hypothetical protein
MCGGIYIKPVNTKTMRCHDGKRKEECYIGSIKSSAVDPFGNLKSDEQALIHGKVDNKVDYGFILIDATYIPKGTQKPSGTYYGVKNNGIVCIALVGQNCPSFDEYKLNSKDSNKLNLVDLSHSGATEKEINQAMQLMADGKVVPVLGVNHRTRGVNGTGLTLMGSRFYLPTPPPQVVVDPLQCKEGYYNNKGVCTTKYGCEFPLIELWTIGGAAPVDGQAVQTQSCTKSCDKPASLLRPGYCQLALP